MKDRSDIIFHIHTPVKNLLSQEEKNIVDLIATLIINKTFENETGTKIPEIQQRRAKQSQHRKAGHSNRRVDEAQ